MSKFLLKNKRDMMRKPEDSDDPFDDHFFCTKYTRLYGVWMNIDKLRESSDKERMKIITELLESIDE